MSDPVTLVTGASSGLGELFARSCAARGKRVALVARRKNHLDQLARKIGKGTLVISEDLTDPDAADAILEAVDKAGCHIYCLINNAGFGARGQFHDLALGDQLDMMQVNMIAVTQLCHAAIPGMIARQGGGILNVASTAAFQAGPNMAVYYATKAYILSFTEALHEELAPYHIHVTALCPGATKTEFADQADMADTQLFKKFAGDPAAVVEAGLKGLDKNKAVVVPGLINKVMVQSNRITPRSVTREIVKQLQG
ncbi:SDR family NAD(P)-dependent oxidoreductase [Parasphingopyxis marina]|uniref:SDR family oxidoreductase n=1 Tax=Parasphingopyxis marina TaxID=2761622 RepID=A0A842HY20_9SPHN|nr:SDR family oxidoreductase [Parasphingopyxis marina]MBC2776820.1 SDR family oxidoreductase [Parasphingopyxis marina]